MPHEADRNGDDGQDATSASQSKRPSLRHRDASDYSQTSDHTRDSTSSTREHHHRPKHHHHHQKHVVGGGRLHARIPSSKALHKQQNTAHAFKLNNQRRHHSPSPEREREREPEPEPEPERDRDRTERPTKPGHRRVQSEAKLSRDSSSSNLKSNTSAASLRRNRSHVEVAHKRTKSSDKLKRTASNPAVNKVKASTKSQVHFDLGSDGQEDEWVDASGSASPYLSRRGSMASGQGSAKPGSSAGTGSRPHTPADKASPPSPPSPPVMSTPDRQTLQHKEYLTSRLLQRTPSQGVVPPQITNDTAEPVSRNRSTDSFGRQSTLDDDSNSVNAAGSAGGDELTSRFVGAASSGNTRNSSFYHPDPSRPTSRRSDAAPDTPHRALSTTSSNRTPASGNSDIDDTSALAPRNARRNAPQSRVQQKLNLQRASSVIEPSSTSTHSSAHHHAGGMSTMGLGMGMGMGMGMSLGGLNTVGATPLVAVANPGHDGGTSRDPRVAKQLERTGMEYLSVRRYQNPVVRSLDRIAAAVQAAKKPQRIPHGRNGLMAASKPPALRPAGAGHARNVSLGAASATGTGNSHSRPVTPRAQSVRTLRSTGAGSSFDADGGGGGGTTTQLSGSSLVGGEDDDAAGEGLNALLRNLWEKNMNLSASQD
ncbi:hypothetical protein VD0003_g4285 [Verticillium dahliae]|nr:hypothetical protein VD0003_g4285 [Verticillium dahliae]